MEKQGLGTKGWGVGSKGLPLRMGRSGFGTLLVIAVVVMSSVAASAAGSGRGSDRKLGITVSVYDFTHLPVGTLTTAEMRATNIFRKAGLAMRWCNVPMSSAEDPMGSNCNQPADPSGIELRIVSQVKVMPGKTTDLTQGFALGNMATVSYHWIVDADTGTFVKPAEILACVIAHEIGHLLLGPNSHSRTGIMMGKWSPDAFRDAGQGRLLFTPQQEKLIRADVLARSGEPGGSITQMGASRK
jgi:hypothetical protein